MSTMKILLSFGTLILFFLVICISLVKSNYDLKKRTAQIGAVNEKKLKHQVGEEKIKVRKDLDEKYRANMESFTEIYKRVELQKKRIKNLEDQVK